MLSQLRVIEYLTESTRSCERTVLLLHLINLRCHLLNLLGSASRVRCELCNSHGGIRHLGSNGYRDLRVSLLRAEHQCERCRETKRPDAFEGETLEQTHSHLSIGHGEHWAVCPTCRSVDLSICLGIAPSTGVPFLG